MALVQNLGIVGHGRRTGTPKSETVFVLPQEELDRIHHSLTKAERADIERQERAAAIKASYEKSKNTVSKWNNTIEGQRKAKLAAKAKRLEEEEIAKQKLDLEEELWRAEERRRVIDQAKKLQFEATDRTKEFHAALGFVEVLKERELQLEAKKQREKIQLTAETDYQAQMRAEIDAATKFEAERVLQRKSNNKKNQKDLESQIRYRKDQKLAEKEADVIEGETLAQLASVEKAEKNRKKEIEIEQRKEMKFLLDKQLEMNREFQQEVTKTDKIEEDKRKIYTNAKDKMSSMRQAKIAEIFKTQQERRGQLAAKLAKEYKEAEDDIEERMEKARKEKDEKQEKIDAKKREKRAKALVEIEKHLQLQLQVKDLAREERRKMDLQERSEKEKADNIFKNAQKKKMESKRSKNEEVAKDLISKVNAQAADERRTRELQLSLEQKQLESMKQEEDEFQQYASEIIKQAEKTERNSFPLKVVAAKGPGGGHGPVNPITGLRPSYLSSDAFGNQMPTYKNDQTNEIRRNVEPGSAKTGKRRLGFTW